MFEAGAEPSRGCLKRTDARVQQERVGAQRDGDGMSKKAYILYIHIDTHIFHKREK